MRISNIHRALIAAFVVVVTGSSSFADWHTFWHNVAVGHHRTNAWPDPFREADALQVIAPFEIMKRNGWRLHNTIGHNLFREGDGGLLASGHNTVRWIATQAPESRREIYVVRARSESETQARVESVKEAVASVNRGERLVNVYVTDREPSSSSGAWLMQVQRDWLENVPAPVLPNTSASGTEAVTTQ